MLALSLLLSVPRCFLDKVTLHLENMASHEWHTPTQGVKTRGKIIRGMGVIEGLQPDHTIIKEEISAFVFISATIVGS